MSHSPTTTRHGTCALLFSARFVTPRTATGHAHPHRPGDSRRAERDRPHRGSVHNKRERDETRETDGERREVEDLFFLTTLTIHNAVVAMNHNSVSTCSHQSPRPARARRLTIDYDL